MSDGKDRRARALTAAVVLTGALVIVGFAYGSPAYVVAGAAGLVLAALVDCARWIAVGRRQAAYDRAWAAGYDEGQREASRTFGLAVEEGETRVRWRWPERGPGPGLTDDYDELTAAWERWMP